MQKKSFNELGVNSDIVRALSKCGITEPTDIQEQAIPIIKSGKDIIGKSKTGSGKTAAFGIPLINKVIPNKGVQALILAPTRELAVQISRELGKFGKYSKIGIATVYGGVSLRPQIRDIAKAEIVVSTPGRLLDHLQQRNIDLSKLTHFVLDEADRLVDMGFIRDIERILSYTPKRKQMVLFGATISQEISRIKQRHMHTPVVAESEVHVAEEYLEQYYYNVQKQEKFSLLVHLLANEDTDQAIVFCSNRHTVEKVSKNLRKQGVKIGMIHGRLTQNKRLRIIGQFNNGRTELLVASPVVARGIDIKSVSHIFNYDLSDDPQEYIHRVGRTARGGSTGKAITLLSNQDHDIFRQILNNYDINIKELTSDKFPKLKFDVSGASGNRSPRPGRRWGNRDSSNRSNSRSRRSNDSTPNEGSSRGPRRFGNKRSRSNDSKPSEGRSRNFGNGRSRSNDSKPSEGRSRGPRRFGNKKARSSSFSRPSRNKNPKASRVGSTMPNPRSR